MYKHFKCFIELLFYNLFIIEVIIHGLVDILKMITN